MLADGFDREGEGRLQSSNDPIATSVRRIRSALATWTGRGERPLLIVDEAHLIDDPATFEALRLLLNFATRGTPDLRCSWSAAPT